MKQFCFHLLKNFVPFKKVLSFGNKNKIGFILYFPHLIVPLHPQIKKVTIR